MPDTEPVSAYNLYYFVKGLGAYVKDTKGCNGFDEGKYEIVACWRWVDKEQ